MARHAPRSLTVCPSCRRAAGHRGRRRHVLERALGLVRVYPYRCESCGLRFLAFRPDVWYSRRSRDARTHERVAVVVPALLERDGEQAAVELIELSAQGCALATAPALPRGTVLRMVLRPGPPNPPITIASAVVRSAGPDRLGLEFVELGTGDRARLEKLLLATRGYAAGMVGERRRSGRRSSLVAALVTIALAVLAVVVLRALWS